MYVTTLLVLLLFSPEKDVAPVLRVPCRVVEVVDGDTLTVEVTLQARVRLLDCWAPEMNTREGKVSRVRMVELAQGKQGMLEVPLSPRLRLDDMLTFGRLLGKVHVAGQDVGQQLVNENLATREKKP